MNPDRQQTIEYLRAPANGLWRWAENGTVIVWKDAGTIAFREEIEQILEWLKPNGLPSFGAIVFLLAALRDKLPAVTDIVAENNFALPTKMGADAALLVSARRQLKAQLEVALVQLGKAKQLPSELKSGVKAKCVLAEAVFEPARVERYVQAPVILRGLKERFSDDELTDGERTGISGSYVRQIHVVAEGLKLHTPESLALRLRTGLDSFPAEIDKALPPAERARKLIEELSRDSDFGAMARAARELMAAVRLPRRLGEREQLAVGGVADITNRGPLDRLLLSELAHDDLTLSVRVALNEALYLRREPPMREPPGTLAILLDSGVRLWGTPRVLAAAVALALVARDKQHAEVLAWRANGKELAAIDLLSKQGLTQHLAALETAPHPGEAVGAFIAATDGGEQNQSVLITHLDTLHDPEFRQALATSVSGPGFVAAVGRNGRFELHALPLARRAAICEADLDLDSIFKEAAGVPVLRPEIDPNLPAIFGVSPLPFLQPLAGKIDLWTKAENGFSYAVLNDRRLVQFRDQLSGGRELVTDLPGGKTLWMECVAGTVHAVKTGASQRPARLLSQPLPEGPLRVNDMTVGADLLAVHRDGDVILAIRSHDVRAYALSDGRMLGRVLNPLHWVNGRYFRGENGFHFVAWDGENVKFEIATMPNNYPLETIVTIFDRAGVDGPWLLTKAGEVVSTATDEVIKLPRPADMRVKFTMPQLSHDGHQLFFPLNDEQARNHPSGCLVTLETGVTATTFNARPGARFAFDSAPPFPTWNVFRVVEAVAPLPDGLAFSGRKNRWRKIVLANPDSIRILNASANDLAFLNKVTLGAAKPTGRGCLLQAAEWPSGVKVFLDSRGLLHFKTPDASPEVSLVLADGEVAGWTSDGHVCGPKFFFENDFVSEPRKVFERLMAILKRV